MNYFNDNTEKSTPPGFSMNQFTNPFSFSDRLASPPVDAGDEGCQSSSFSGRVSEENGSDQPNFRSVQPVPLPIYPSSFAASELRDSPFLLNISNILPSPTTGAFQFHNFNSNSYSICNSEGKDNTSAWSLQESSELQDAAKSEYISSQITSHETATAQAKSDCETERKVKFQSNCENYQNQTQLYRREDRKSDDGYNWRKYGQKQMKGSQNPRSYFKCTYPNCPTTKKVERSLDGQITEIVYRGKHSHPMPQSTRRSSSSYSSGSAVTSSASQVSNPRSAKTRDQSSVVQDIGRVDSVATSVNSSVSVDNGNFDESSRIRKGRLGDVHEFDEKEPDAKRWKEESGNQEIPGLEGRTVREPRVVVRTTSDIDVLDDGYRWRKYGQKVVKGNPNPRNYYKCTHPGCGVRKHVERAADDLRAVITTYEGKHKHAVPLTRRSHNHTVGRPFPRNDNVKMHPFSESEAPFSLEIVPRNLGFLGSENSVGSFMTQAHNSNYGVSATNESKNSSLLLLESLLD